MLLIDLPPELLLNIFSHLKQNDILATSETCVKFNELINDNSQISNKLILYINYPLKHGQFPKTDLIRDYKKMKITFMPSRKDDDTGAKISERVSSTIQNLEINYENLELLLQLMMKDEREFSFEHSQRRAILRMNVVEGVRAQRIDIHEARALEQIIALQTEEAQIRERNLRKLSTEFFEILVNFCNLRSLKVNDVFGFNCTQTLPNLSNIQELTISHRCGVQTLTFFKSCENLKKLTIEHLRSDGEFDLGSFIANLKHLKYLHIDDCYAPLDNLENAQFKLKHLSFANVKFDQRQSGERFFASQNELETLHFQIAHNTNRYQAIENLELYNIMLNIGKFKLMPFFIFS